MEKWSSLSVNWYLLDVYRLPSLCWTFKYIPAVIVFIPTSSNKDRVGEDMCIFRLRLAVPLYGRHLRKWRTESNRIGAPSRGPCEHSEDCYGISLVHPFDETMYLTTSPASYIVCVSFVLKHSTIAIVSEVSQPHSSPTINA